MAMRPVPFRTVARPARFAGVGLFSGQQGVVTVEPAGAGQGLSLRREDGSGGGGGLGGAVITVCAKRVIARPRQTVLAASGPGPAVTVQTVEHLLSALAACGVNTAVLRVSGPEIPILDGSARVFVEGLLEAGVVALDGAGVEVVLEPVGVMEFVEGSMQIEARPWPEGTPGPRLGLEYVLDYGGPIAAQSARFVLDYVEPDVAGYGREIGPARTFCTEVEATQWRAAGLFGHMTAAQVLVMGEDGPVGSALRFAEEPARHKVLDMLGDLSLAGRPIHAQVRAVRSGHALNQRMALALQGLG